MKAQCGRHTAEKGKKDKRWARSGMADGMHPTGAWLQCVEAGPLRHKRLKRQKPPLVAYIALVTSSKRQTQRRSALSSRPTGSRPSRPGRATLQTLATTPQRPVQEWRGHRFIPHTVRCSELASIRFKILARHRQQARRHIAGAQSSAADFGACPCSTRNRPEPWDSVWDSRGTAPNKVSQCSIAMRQAILR